MSNEKRELIRKAAIKVFSKYGFHKSSTDKIAVEAGIAVGTIYNYFKSKDDILNYIFETEYNKRISYVQEVKEKNIHPLEKIRFILIKHFEELEKEPDIARIILSERKFPHRCELGGVEKFEGLPRFIAEILQDGIQAGTLRECNVEIMALALFGAIEGIMAQYILEYDNNIRTNILAESVEEIYTLLSRGLRE
jgi:TetR/AcrR family fatty acid metabolism transcriptional regulator